MSSGSANRLPADAPSDAEQHELRLIRTARREFGLVGAVRMPASETSSQRDGDVDARAIEIPGYCELEKLHAGGQGLVLRARQQSTGQAVAIKVLHDTALHEPREQHRLEREVEILAGLNHPNIVSVIDTGTIGRSRFLVMPFVDGWSLDSYVRHNHLSPREIAATLAKVADAVHSAHLHGVIHRDLKPGNVRVDRRGEPKILDFGLAKQSLADASSMDQTQTGQFVGSLPWASPEQVAAGAARVDVRSDLYSLGVILYQLLADRFPYPVSGALRDVIDHIQHTEPAALRRLNALDRSEGGLARIGRQPIDDELETVVLKCLNKDPVRRYQSAGDLARDLRHYLAGEAIEAKRDSPGYLLRKYLARHKLAVAIALGAAALVVSASAVSFVFWRRAEGAVVRAKESESAFRSESQKLEAVVRFIDEKVFGSVKPDARGRDVTVREILDAAAVELDGPSKLAPEVEAELRHTIGVAYRHLGVFDAAERQMRAGMALRPATDTPTNRIEWSNDINSLAVLLFLRGKYDEAEKLAGEALDMVRDSSGADSLDVAVAECNLGGIVAAKDDFERGEALIRDALRIREARLGSRHPHVANTFNTLGDLFLRKRDFAQAEQQFERALAIWREGPDGGDPSLAMGLINLSGCRRERRDLIGAEACLTEARPLVQRQYGVEHWVWAVFLHARAQVHLESDNLSAAEQDVRAALALRRRILQDTHPDVFKSALLLSAVELKKGDYAAAESACREAIELGRRSLKPDDWRMTRAQARLGAVFARSGRYAEAEPMLVAAFETMSANPNAPADNAPTTAEELARLYEAWDAAEPGNGYDAKAVEWRARFAKPTSNP